MLRSAMVRDLRILAYHRVLSIEDEDAFGFDLDLVSASAEQFRAQMEWLRRHYVPIRFRDVIEAWEQGRSLSPKSVIVTFDDGYDDNYRIAFPILQELGVPATFFVSTGHVDSGRAYAYDWLVHMLVHSPAARLRIGELEIEEALPESRSARRLVAARLLDRMKWLDAGLQSTIIEGLEHEWGMPRESGHPDCRPVNWDQLREMQAAGMEIGSHGIWHNMLAKLPAQAMLAEVAESKLTIDRELLADTDVISYPVGGHDAYNNAVIDAVRESGYRLGCSYVAGTSQVPRQPEFELRRLPIERHMDQAWFASLLGIPEAFTYPSRQRIG
ncbi:polysaccharide deacetylase family protein [Dokdonella sp.]|uniref:polysaccharide deacetylase family protein n=1 Tax=Dokdonella sp. TaxID=2291710 RepID=UPI003C3D8B4C